MWIPHRHPLCHSPRYSYPTQLLGWSVSEATSPLGSHCGARARRCPDLQILSCSIHGNLEEEGPHHLGADRQTYRLSEAGDQPGPLQPWLPWANVGDSGRQPYHLQVPQRGCGSLGSTWQVPQAQLGLLSKPALMPGLSWGEPPARGHPELSASTSCGRGPRAVCVHLQRPPRGTGPSVRGQCPAAGREGWGLL